MQEMTSQANNKRYWLRADGPRRLVASVKGMMPMLQLMVVKSAMISPNMLMNFYKASGRIRTFSENTAANAHQSRAAVYG